MKTKEELELRYKRAQESYEYAKQKEMEAIRALADSTQSREKAKERVTEAFLALEAHRAKTERASVGY